MRLSNWTWVAFLCAVLIGSALTRYPAYAASEPLSGVALEAAIADYKVKLESYTQARQAYEQDAKAYWTLVADKRRARNEKRRGQQPIVLTDYVLTQPPVYRGSAGADQSGAATARSPAAKAGCTGGGRFSAGGA